MLQYLYEWIQNMAFYLVIVTAAIQVLPGKEYKKYVQFFTGMVTILLCLSPILKLTNVEYRLTDLYRSKEYERAKKEVEEYGKLFEEDKFLDFLPEIYPDQLIEVEAITIDE